MTWSDPRPSARPLGAAGIGGLRDVAHSDDAKHRLDETHHHPAPRRLPSGRVLRWGVPAMAAVAVVVVIGGVAALGGSPEAPAPEASGAGASTGEPDPAEADPTEPVTIPPTGAPDLSGTYGGTTFTEFVPSTGDPSPSRTEDVTGAVVCDAEQCLIQVDFLTDRFRRPISVPAAGGTDSFSRPAAGGPPCDRDESVSAEARSEGSVSLGPDGLEWRLVNHADKYSTCPGGVFMGGSVSTGTATRG